MREELESLLLVLAIGSSVAIGAKRARVPFNIALVLGGLLLVFMDVLPRTPLDPQLVLVAFLPILVFEGALGADQEGLAAARGPILALAIPGVVISLLATAGVATFALQLPFSAALLLGALLAITDTVSVLLAFRSVAVPRRLAAIMEGESLFNDGTALVLVSVTSAVVIVGRFDASAKARSLVIAIVGGVAVGAAFGAIGRLVLSRTQDHLNAILASMVVVFATALLSERGHASPVIAVVVLGLMLGRAARQTLEPSSVIALLSFWQMAGFIVNVFLFLLVGMQIEARMLIAEAGSILLALVALHAGRAVAVYGSFAAIRAGGERTPAAWQHVMVFGNIKGAISMAAVLALPASMPHRDRLLTIVFGVTFVTLVSQGLPFKRVLTLLGVAEGHEDPVLGEAKATLIAARRGQQELDRLFGDGFLSRQEHAERKAKFQRDVIASELVLRGPTGTGARSELVEVALLQAQKAALLEAAQRGLLNEEAAANRIGEVDRELLKYGGHEE